MIDYVEIAREAMDGYIRRHRVPYAPDEGAYDPDIEVGEVAAECPPAEGAGRLSAPEQPTPADPENTEATGSEVLEPNTEPTEADDDRSSGEGASGRSPDGEDRPDGEESTEGDVVGQFRLAMVVEALRRHFSKYPEASYGNVAELYWPEVFSALRFEPTVGEAEEAQARILGL